MILVGVLLPGSSGDFGSNTKKREIRTTMTELQLRTIRLGKTCEGGTFGFSIGRLPSMPWKRKKEIQKNLLNFLLPLSTGPSGRRDHVIARVNKDIAHMLHHGDELVAVNGKATHGVPHENVIQQVSPRK